MDPWLLLFLNSPWGAYLTSDDLPLDPPALSGLLPGYPIEVNGYDGVILGNLTRLEAVPEPVSIALLAPLALGLLAIRRR